MFQRKLHRFVDIEHPWEKTEQQEPATRREFADPPAIDATRGMDDDTRRWLAWWCREKVNREWSGVLARAPPLFPVGWRLTISFIIAMAVDSHICKYARRDRLTKIRIVIKKNGFKKFIVMAMCRQYYDSFRLGGCVKRVVVITQDKLHISVKVASRAVFEQLERRVFFFSPRDSVNFVRFADFRIVSIVHLDGLDVETKPIRIGYRSLTTMIPPSGLSCHRQVITRIRFHFRFRIMNTIYCVPFLTSSPSSAIVVEGVDFCATP